MVKASLLPVQNTAGEKLGDCVFKLDVANTKFSAIHLWLDLGASGLV